VNKDLYNKKIKVPDEIREHMRNSFSSVSSESNDEGHKRNKELQGSEEITYQQLKRIKNFFDNYKGDQNGPEFHLNGGVKMKQFVESILSGARRGLELSDRNRRDTGMQMDREYDLKLPNMNISPSKEHKAGPEKHMNEEVVQSLKRINEIMEKLWQL